MMGWSGLAQMDENIHVEGGYRLQVKGRSDRAADRIAADDAIGLHLVDDLDGVGDVRCSESYRVSKQAARLYMGAPRV